VPVAVSGSQPQLLRLGLRVTNSFPIRLIDAHNRPYGLYIKVYSIWQSYNHVCILLFVYFFNLCR